MSEKHLDQEIVQRFHAGQSQRGIARDLHVGRSRIRRVLAEHQRVRDGSLETTALPKPRRKRKSQLDEYRNAMRELVARYPHITAVRMHEELRAQGFGGSYSVVRDAMREIRAHPRRPLVERFETGPGRQAQMDYAQYDLDFTYEGRRRVYLFSYLLAWSRRQYLCFTESQDFATTVRHHMRAFEYLNGVAATCLYDNMKVVVSRWEDDQPIYNTRFLAFATHYGYRPIACRPRRPQTKGKVERPFHYVETNLLNARTFHSLEHLNECTRRWLNETADVRVHRQTRRRPIDLHAEERPHLISLPANPYDVAAVVYRSVDCEGFITYRHNQYSVPWRYVGQVLPLRITESELFVYGPHIEEIARHVLLPSTTTHQRQILPGHRPTESRRMQDERLQESFDAFGETGQVFLKGLLASHRQGKAQARKVLALRALYHHHDLVQALARAVTYGAFSFSSVERILGVEAEPKTNLEILAEQEKDRLCQLLKDASVRPRKTADYQKLLFPEQTDGQDIDPDSEDDANREEGPSGEVAGPDSGPLSDPPRPDDADPTG